MLICKERAKVLFIVVFLIIFFNALAYSNEKHLHFRHPLITESPTPDTKLRTDYLFSNLGRGDQLYSINLEGEYSFLPNVALEFDIPYVVLDIAGHRSSSLDSISLGIKSANLLFQDKGVVFGGGFEVSLPTGDTSKGIGSSSKVTYAPVIDFGYKKGGFEAIIFSSFEFSTNESNSEEDDIVLEYQSAISYLIVRNIALGLEGWGEVLLDGEDRGEATFYLTPEITFQWGRWNFGVGASFPLTSAREFNFSVLTSLFYHFHD